MGKFVTTPLPQDLPEDWNDSQYVSPGGVETGLTEKHGYNYLMQQVNATQKAVQELDEGVEKVLFHTGKDALTPTTTGYSTLFEYIKSLHDKGIVHVIAKINSFADLPRPSWGYLLNAYNSEGKMWDVQITEAVNNRMFLRQLNATTKWIKDTWGRIVISTFDDELVFARPDSIGSSRLLKNNNAESDYGFSIRDYTQEGSEARLNVIASEQVVSAAFRSSKDGALVNYALLHTGNFKQIAAPAGLVRSFISAAAEAEVNNAIDTFVSNTKDNGVETFLLEVTLSSVIPSDLYFITVRRHMDNYVTVTGHGVMSATENTIHRRKINGVWYDWKTVTSTDVLDASVE